MLLAQIRETLVLRLALTAPFASNSNVCPAGVLNPTYANMSYSKISMQVSLGTTMTYVFAPLRNARGELYANAVAYGAYDNSSPPMTWNYKSSDQVISNGYFGCTLACATVDSSRHLPSGFVLWRQCARWLHARAIVQAIVYGEYMP
jgi:hypothetical protein